MSNDGSIYYSHLLKELITIPGETEWIEFKMNNQDPQEIGEYISALANTAALYGKSFGYVIWGIEDSSHNIIGTNFNPKKAKKGNEELENWLFRLISPKINFSFHEFKYEGLNIVILEINRAITNPIQFMGHEFIRIGTAKKNLKDYPEKERALWRIFDNTPFDMLSARDNLTEDNVLQYLAYPDYFDMFHLPLPDNRKGILKRLEDDSLIRNEQNGLWKITNTGAILFAKKLDDYPYIKRKAVRVIVYKGCSRVETLKEQVGNKGYASGFEGLIEYIKNLIPSNEIIEKALRKDVPMYPEIAIRELVANAIIHQDFTITGAGPMIEIFSDRMEITNPGIPLIETDRFLDTPPRSRNENIAGFMRRVGVCEERGSGIDKVVFQTELFQLPAPLIEVIENNTRVTLFAYRSYSDMDRKERVRAAYLHACLRYVQKNYLTNTSLRERFGIAKENSAMISRLIKDAVEDRAIKPVDPESDSRKHARYQPIWA